MVAIQSSNHLRSETNRGSGSRASLNYGSFQDWFGGVGRLWGGGCGLETNELVRGDGTVLIRNNDNSRNTNNNNNKKHHQQQ